MIKGYESPHLLEPEKPGRFQLRAALGAGFVAGVVLLLVPRGNPWSALTFFSPAVMGRMIPGWLGMPVLLGWVTHLVVSLFYGLIISRMVATLKHQRAFVIGALAGLVLYVLNFGVVSAFWPGLRGAEFSVVIAHIVFGLISAGAYRGLLKRQPELPAPGVM